MYQFTIPESAQPGSVVGELHAKDNDEGRNAEMEYKIVSEEGRDIFKITTDKDNQKGILTLNRVSIYPAIPYGPTAHCPHTHLFARHYIYIWVCNIIYLFQSLFFFPPNTLPYAFIHKYSFLYILLRTSVSHNIFVLYLVYLSISHLFLHSSMASLCVPVDFFLPVKL